MTKLPVVPLVLGTLPSAYNFLKHESVYGIAANYNVSIYYNPDSGKIERIIFHRKTE